MRNPRRAFYKAADEERQEKQRLANATNAYKKAHAKKTDKGLVYYTEDQRRGIYEQAKSLGFSAQDLEKMEYYLEPEHWNQDEICRTENGSTIDAVDLFYKAEQFLNDNVQEKPLRGKIFDVIAFFGNDVNDIDEEEELNDN